MKMNQPQFQSFYQPPKKAPWWRRLRPSAVITIAIVLLLLTVSLVAGAMAFAKKPTPLAQATQMSATSGTKAVKATPTIILRPSGQWMTVKTFTGKGSQKTLLFTVPNNWRIVWSCDLTSHNNTSYYLFVHATSAVNTLLDDSVETTCSQNNTQNFSQLHQGGKVYLNILSQGSWIIQVQALK